MRPLRWQHVSVVIQNDIIVAGMNFQVCRDFLSSSCRTVNITVNDGEQDGSNANNLVGEREGNLGDITSDFEQHPGTSFS